MYAAGRNIHAFRQGWVDVHGSGDVMKAGADLHGDDQFVDQVVTLGADDVSAQDLVGLVICDDLDEPVGLADGPSFRYRF